MSFTFARFMTECDRVLDETVGGSTADLVDSPWHDMWEDGLSPVEAVRTSLVEWNGLDEHEASYLLDDRRTGR